MLCLYLSGYAQEPLEFWIRRKNTTVNLYKVTAVRNNSEYPATPQGYEKFRQDVTNGLVVRTTDEGCVIPIGTKAPLTKPTCSTTISINYNETFGVVGKGTGNEYDKPGTIDGKIKEGELVWTIPNLPAPGSYTLVHQYQSTSQVPTAQFYVNNGSVQPLTLEASGGQLRTATIVLSGFTQGTNTIKMTPSGYIATASIQLTRVGSTTTGTGTVGCDYNLAVNSPTVSCGASATLTATATGTAASGITYNWTGPNNFVASDASVVANLAQNGFYTYTVTVTKAGCANKTASSTVTMTGCSATLAYNKVLIVGNSITYYPAPRTNWPGTPRGMAATAPEKDFVRILTAKLRTQNANVQVRTFADFATETSNQINESTGPLWEAGYWTANLETFNPVAAWQPDLVVMRLAENITDPTHSLLSYYLALIDKLKSQSPNAKIVLTPSVWGQTEVTNAIAQAAAQRGYPYASTLASMWTFENDPANPYYAWGVYADAGVNKHPNDAGMQRIADEIYAKIPSNNPNPPAPGISTPGYGNLFADNSTYTDLPEFNRPSSSLQFPRAFIINGNTRVAINTKLGSVIDYMSFDGGLFSTVNSPIWPSNQKDDAGRQLMDAAYMNPNGSVNAYGEGHYEEAGQSTAQMHSAGQGSIGNNPVQGGSIGQNPLYGLTEVCYSDGSKLFYKTRPAQWDMVNIYGQMRMRGWIDIDPTNSKVVRRHARWEMQRVDPYTAFYPTPRQQEWPCWYTTTDWKQVFYRSGRPFTNAPLVEYTYDEGYENIVPPPILASEPVIYMRNRTNPNLYIAIITNGARFSVGGFNNEYITGNAPTSFKANYIGVTPLMSLDPDGVYDGDAAFMQGTLAEIDNYVYNHVRLRAQWNGRFSYVFNNKSRLGFFLHKAKDQLEKNITDYISVKPLTNTENAGRDYNISTPERWIDGRVVKHVYVRMAVTSSDGAMWLRWNKPGLVNSGEYFREFNVTADGQFRTYDIDMTGVANWDGTDITSFVLRKRNNNDVSNDELKIKWISDTDLTSTNP